MVQNETDDDDEDAEEDDTPALAASQALDIIALNLPPEKYISALLSQVSTSTQQTPGEIYIRPTLTGEY